MAWFWKRNSAPLAEPPAAEASPTSPEEAFMAGAAAKEEEAAVYEGEEVGPEVIARCKAMTAAELHQLEQDVVVRGMHLFFGNHFLEAEALFKANMRTDPLAANALGTLWTIRGCLSVNQTEIDAALRQLTFSSHFAAQVAPQLSAIGFTVSRVVGWWQGTSGLKSMSPAEFRAMVAVAEAETLRSILLLLQENVAAYVRAGFALRKSYLYYDILSRYVEDLEKKGVVSEAADRSSVEGMHFGVGCIHTVTSILPPKILILLKALGYMHDRQLGFFHLHHCLNSNTFRSPLASLFLLAFHGLLPSFAVLTVPKSLPIARKVLEQTLAVYPDSIIHSWLGGRIQRLEKDLDGSIATLDGCVAKGEVTSLNKHLPQLKHFALYDLAWSHCTAGNWEKAIACLAMLEAESTLKKLYAYAQGCCWEQVALNLIPKDLWFTFTSIDELEQKLKLLPPSGDAGDKDEAAAVFEAAASALREASKCYHRSRRHAPILLAGKLISVDKFVIRRVDLMTSASLGAPVTKKTPEESLAPLTLANTIRLPGVELTCIFNLLTQASQPALPAMLGLVNTLLPKCRPQGVLKYLSCLAAAKVARPQAQHTDLSGAVVLEQGGAGGKDFKSLVDPNDEGAVMLLIKANILRVLGKTSAAEEIYTSLHRSDVLILQQELWVAPYALYEHAVMRYRDCNDKEGFDFLISRLKSRGEKYNFELPMQFRLHLTYDVFRQEKNCETTHATNTEPHASE